MHARWPLREYPLREYIDSIHRTSVQDRYSAIQTALICQSASTERRYQVVTIGDQPPPLRKGNHVSEEYWSIYG
jgi:hypothetical protein